MNHRAQVHYLRANHKVWTPASVMFFDTETDTITEPGRDVLALRLWVGHMVDRRPPKTGKPLDWEHSGRTGADLAAWVAQLNHKRQSLWCFAYNLGFDLVTTRLPMEMAALGYRITGCALSGRAAYFTFSNGKGSVTFADAASWLPGGLSEVAAVLGTHKTALPLEGDDESVWYARCATDVDILADAMLDLMAWWDRGELGRWWATGPSCGWNSYRHTPTSWKVTIDPDPARVARDRTAIHGGRRGVWRVGLVRAGRLAELDFKQAHLTVAQHLPLPTKPLATFDRLPRYIDPADQRTMGILARVRIRTDVPRWPVRVGAWRCYPVGEFWTVLSGPDIEAAARLGCLVEVGPGQVHTLGYAMAPWAEWCRSVADGLAVDAPAVARITAKHWGRTVVGGWARRAYTMTSWGPSPVYGWNVEAGWDVAGQCRGSVVDIAGERWWSAANGDPENAYPAVFAWVEGHVRTRLNAAIELIGNGAMVQADTDGMIVNADRLIPAARRGPQAATTAVTDVSAVNATLDRVNAATWPLVLREKRSWDRATVLGPQHVETPDYRRFAGVRADFVRDADGKFRGKLWPGITWQMSQGDPRGYVRPMAETSVTGPYAQAWVLADGSVQPCRTVIADDGATRILPWAAMPAGQRTRALADKQHPMLRGLW